MHADGLHYVGDWHTHPDPVPLPSMTDLHSISECLIRSRHELNAFVMVIVGTAPLPEALHVSVHDGTSHTVLKPMSGNLELSKKAPLAKRILKRILKKDGEGV